MNDEQWLEMSDRLSSIMALAQITMAIVKSDENCNPVWYRWLGELTDMLAHQAGDILGDGPA